MTKSHKERWMRMAGILKEAPFDKKKWDDERKKGDWDPHGMSTKDRPVPSHMQAQWETDSPRSSMREDGVEATPDQEEWDAEKSEWDPSDDDSEWKPAKDEEGWDPSDEDEWLAEELKMMNEQSSGQKVYVLVHEGDFDPYDTYGVYSSLEKAKEAIVDSIKETESGKIGGGKDWIVFEQPLDTYLRYNEVFSFDVRKDEPFWKSDSDVNENAESWHDDPEMVHHAKLAKKAKGLDKAEKEKKARAQAGKASREDLGYDPDYWEELRRLA